MQGEDLLSYLDNIKRHLAVEQTVLNAWSQKDEDKTSAQKNAMKKVQSEKVKKPSQNEETKPVDPGTNQMERAETFSKTRNNPLDENIVVEKKQDDELQKLVYGVR